MYDNPADTDPPLEQEEGINPEHADPPKKV